ncbi:MAG: hypothetical protein HY000_19795 [Planctomycetes bacterium]|nr:hypothetical protein [Planctomycetota bacterium]
MHSCLITLVLCAAPGFGDCSAMPQECYNPRYGCYFCGRWCQRYPAFHGYYYRAPYNYRHYSEYPWYACRHTPQPFYVGGIRGVYTGATVAPAPEPVPMLPPEFTQTRATVPQRPVYPTAQNLGPWLR